MKIGTTLVSLAMLSQLAMAEGEPKLAFECEKEGNPHYQVTLSLGEVLDKGGPSFFSPSYVQYSDVAITGPRLYLNFEGVETEVQTQSTRAGYVSHFKTNLGSGNSLKLSQSVYQIGQAVGRTLYVKGSLTLDGQVTPLDCKAWVEPQSIDDSSEE